MTFKDAIKSSVLERIAANDIGTMTILTTLGIAGLLGLYIYLVYRLTTKSGFYNRGFNKTLTILPVITAGILLAMQSNLAISLGMVGALSIIRFRNAVKDSSDLMYLFWSISIGIVVGAGLYELAVLLCLVITVFWNGLDLLPNARMPYLLVVSTDGSSQEDGLLTAVKTFAPRARVRSRNVTRQGSDWILELQVKDPQGLVKAVSGLEGIHSVNLLTHDGEVRF